ncbi:MAG: transcription antitermination factor NusB [Arcobacter butzleri]|jgi:N utilization substance protein B|nr:transcription antitermination factor NusB [Arcobacteraceae bacterium]MDY0365905.1 transcription antitermination factor NusB [Arcobacteraceae bacterium]NLO16786.1 transcription antitermination factor NusB [Aliarcobacter butzleri]
MATRTQARESVISLLYAYDLGNDKISKFSDEILEDKKIRNKQKAFADSLYHGVMEHLEAVDKEIESHLRKNNMEDLGSVEKAILRLATYEIMFSELDKPVVINEAVEIAKRLASDNGPKLINAVLDNIEKV